MKIFAKLILIIGCLSIFSLVLVGAFSFTSTKNMLQEQIGNAQRIHAENIIETIDRLLYERYLNIQSIAEAPVIVWAINGKIPLNEGEKRIKTFFNTTGPWNQLMVMDTAGKVLICTLSTKDEDITKEPEINAGFQAAIKGNGYYSDAVLSTETGRPTIVFAFPIRDSDIIGNPVIGVVAGEYSWPVINEIISDITLPKTAHLYNKDGVMIAASHDTPDVFGNNYKDHPVVQSALKGQEGYLVGPGVGRHADEAQESLIAYVSEDGFLGFHGNGWALSIEEPTQTAFALARSSAWQAVLIVGFIFLVTLLLLMFVVRTSFIRPVTDLAKIVESIREGNLSRRVSVISKDEIGMLGASVNEMAASLWDSRVKLEQYSKGLEEKVAEKTKDLQSKVDDLNKTREAILNIAEDAERAKQQTEQAKVRDDAMLLSIGDGLVAINNDGKIVMNNASFEKLLGWSGKEAQGKMFTDIAVMVDKDGKPIPKEERLITKALRQKTTTTTTTTYQYKRKDGSTFPAAITVSPIILDNVIIGAVEVFRDITKEKEIDKAKTEFVSLASHQLRTPLSSINWYTEMLLAGDAGKINKEQKNYLEEVYKGNKRMVDLVNALLNVSRLELGTFAIEPEPTDVVNIARSVADEQKPQILAKKIKLNQKYANNLPKINADPKLLRIIFQNLLSNAVKYTPDQGTVSIDLYLAKRGKSIDTQKVNEDSIAITVSDTGYGIPKDQQDEIFSKLFRADNVREKDTEGTGLGLYIVKSIVGHSGGQIWFESEKDKGTVFYVTLPLSGMKKKEGTKAIA